jgi:hypothetical protein
MSCVMTVLVAEGANDIVSCLFLLAKMPYG